ncbi:DoxX family membrane protein [Halodurantibacterium flavum]|uniref:DoxX family membrane protein n=1 Tax=Halodurantibacterium flavum TaxID=1382802 RepID=A0ABW4S0X7_9RHOB
MTTAEHILVGIAALLVTAPYWVSAGLKTLWFRATIAEMQALGVEPARPIAQATILVQAFGSAALVLNIFPLAGVLALAAFTVAATCVGHAFWRLPAGERLNGANGFLANVGLVGGLICVALLRYLP